MILISDLLDQAAAPPPSYESVFGSEQSAAEKKEKKTESADGSMLDQAGSSASAQIPSRKEELSPPTLPATTSIWYRICSYILTGSAEDQAIGRAELHRQIRFVCPAAYTAAMVLLRDHYIAAYLAQVKRPFTSDPWRSSSGRNNIAGLARAAGFRKRETKVLDLFVAAEVRRDIERFESDLLEQPGMDGLFDLHQPRARLEDMFVQLGLQRQLLHKNHAIATSAEADNAAAPSPVTVRDRIFADDLTLLFSLKRVDVRLPFLASPTTTSSSASAGQSSFFSTGSSQKPLLVRKTVFSVERQRGTPLEETAEEILAQLADGAAEVRLVRSGSNQAVEGASPPSRGWTWYEAGEEMLQSRGRAPAHPRAISSANGTEAVPAASDNKPRNRFSRWLRKS